MKLHKNNGAIYAILALDTDGSAKTEQNLLLSQGLPSLKSLIGHGYVPTQCHLVSYDNPQLVRTIALLWDQKTYITLGHAQHGAREVCIHNVHTGDVSSEGYLVAKPSSDNWVLDGQDCYTIVKGE